MNKTGRTLLKALMCKKELSRLNKNPKKNPYRTFVNEQQRDCSALDTQVCCKSGTFPQCVKDKDSEHDFNPAQEFTHVTWISVIESEPTVSNQKHKTSVSNRGT